MYIIYERYNHADVGSDFNPTAKERQAKLSLVSFQITEASWENS